MMVLKKQNSDFPSEDFRIKNFSAILNIKKAYDNMYDILVKKLFFRESRESYQKFSLKNIQWRDSELIPRFCKPQCNLEKVIVLLLKVF